MILLLCSALSAAAESEKLLPDWSEAATREAAQIEVIAGLIEAGMIEQALEAVASVRRAGAEGPALDVLQARAMIAAGMPTDARALLERVLRRHPRDASALMAMGVAQADAGELDAAIASLEKASRIRRNDALILNNLGYAYMARGDTEEAVRQFRASLAADPSKARARNNLGFALARLERDMEALQAFRSAEPEADARYNMGVACELRADTASAIANYQAATVASPGHPAASVALARLLTPGSP